MKYRPYKGKMELGLWYRIQMLHQLERWYHPPSSKELEGYHYRSDNPPTMVASTKLQGTGRVPLSFGQSSNNGSTHRAPRNWKGTSIVLTIANIDISILISIFIYLFDLRIICFWQHEHILKKLIFNWVRGQAKVTVTQKWYTTLGHLKMHRHTKFGIPTSNNIGDMLRA